jgi:molybdenum cofactor biosynthesis enzyme MoaA
VFCLNDYDNLIKQKNKWVPKETFKNIIKLLPLVSNGGFMLSCEYEPTLHPEFIDLINMIPSKYRKKIFLTTNFSVPLSDNLIQALSKSNFHHINISLDSLNPKIYESIRIGAKFSVFEKNLKNLISECKKSVSAPKIRFITVALKSNIEEIPHLVEICQNQYGGSFNEIRYCYNFKHLSEEWRVSNLPTNDDWNNLESKFKDIRHHKIKLLRPPNENYYNDSEIDYKTGINSSMEGPVNLHDELIGLRCNSDGVVRLLSREDRFIVDINTIRNPLSFFRKIIRSL